MENNCIEKIQDLKRMLDDGLLTQEEFELMKNRVLNPPQVQTSQQMVSQKKCIPEPILRAIKIVGVIALFLSMLFLVNSRVGYWADGGVPASPFAVSDVRTVFAIISVVFISLTWILLLLNIFSTNAVLTVFNFFLTVATAALTMVSAIFNITYGSNFVHPCSILLLISSSVIVIGCVIVLFWSIYNFACNTDK